MIFTDSPEAASLQTVTGWVSRLGHFYGKDEAMARYDGATHRKCDCGEIMEARSYCMRCSNARADAIFDAMPYVEWNGIDMLVIHNTDQYFANGIDEIKEYCYDNDTNIEDLKLVLCVPVYASPIEPEDYYADDMPEDGMGLSSGLMEAFDVLNNFIRETKEVLCYEPCKSRVRLEDEDVVD